jgi:hypothetical protein
MERADKSAQITKAVLAIRLGEFIDYSNAIKKFYYIHMAIIRRIKCNGLHPIFGPSSRA